MNNKSSLFPSPHLSVIGHRGAGKLAPENTLASFIKAQQVGLNWVEFDIQPAKGGQWVVIHDETLDRTTNGQGPVITASIKSLKTLDAGGKFHPHYRGQRIPLLSETLTLLAEIKIHPNIEIKIPKHFPIQQLEYWLTSLIACVDHYWPLKLPPPLISSFNKTILKAIKRIEPRFPLGLNIEHLKANTLETMFKEGFFSLHCDHTKLNQRQLKKLLKSPFPILLYTVNNSYLAQQYFDRGVTAIFSDLI